MYPIVRGWRNTVANLIEICWLRKAKNEGVRFHRIRDFKQHCTISTVFRQPLNLAMMLCHTGVCEKALLRKRRSLRRASWKSTRSDFRISPGGRKHWKTNNSLAAGIRGWG